MNVTLMVKYFSIFPKSPDYSEKYTHLIVEKQGSKIVSTYYSRTNAKFNKVVEVDLT